MGTFWQVRRFSFAKESNTWYARDMKQDRLPMIISVQDEILDSIGPEQAYAIEEDFRGGASIRELAEKFLSHHEIGVA